jgi:hypothetical protein
MARRVVLKEQERRKRNEKVTRKRSEKIDKERNRERIKKGRQKQRNV